MRPCPDASGRSPRARTLYPSSRTSFAGRRHRHSTRASHREGTSRGLAGASHPASYESASIAVPRRLMRFRNSQDEMHRRDPAKFPRDATRAYYVDGADQRKMYDLMDKGFELSVIYHSHPDTDAYFSPTDNDQAAPPPTREPVWPGITYVVLSVRKGCAHEWAAFRWAEATGDFIEVHRARLAVPEEAEP